MNKKNYLTEKSHWDDRWEKVKLPSIIAPDTDNAVAKEIIKIFEKYLPKEKREILEIGGAPGQFLAYFSKHFGYQASALDYSDVGCSVMEENFRELDLNIKIYNADLFEPTLSLPKFDIVFSMGFIEHFENFAEAVNKHVKLLKKDGILLVGVPNFQGINGFILKRLAPDLLSKHNILSMDAENWHQFEMDNHLTTIFKGYIGGFEPKIFRRCENRSLKNLTIRLFFKLVRYSLTDPLPILRNFNSKYWSAYLLGIYKLDS
ncbi:MAG: class I SAM-dependent methyltransferase [Desulfobacterales bacterium]